MLSAQLSTEAEKHRAGQERKSTDCLRFSGGVSECLVAGTEANDCLRSASPTLGVFIRGLMVGSCLFPHQITVICNFSCYQEQILWFLHSWASWFKNGTERGWFLKKQCGNTFNMSQDLNSYGIMVTDGKETGPYHANFV